MFYEHRVYSVREYDEVERCLEWLCKVFAVLEKHGYKATGPFRTVIGNKFDIFFLLVWESLSQLKKAKESALKDEDVQKLMREGPACTKKASLLLEDV